MKLVVLILSVWTTFASAQQPQNGGEGESCYFVKVIDGKTTSIPLKRDRTRDFKDAIYNACEDIKKDGSCAAMAHNWGGVRDIGDVENQPVFGLRLKGPWKGEGVWLIINTPAGLIRKNQLDPVKDLAEAQRLANEWVAFSRSETFLAMSNDQKERVIFNFLARQFPNGVIAEDKDPSNPENRVYISCQTLY